jgi:hypothetical protein
MVTTVRVGGRHEEALCWLWVMVVAVNIEQSTWRRERATILAWKQTERGSTGARLDYDPSVRAPVRHFLDIGRV